MNLDPDKLVSVASCNHVTEADMLKIALEEHGIDVAIDGATLNTTFGAMAGPVIAGVKLIVRQEDAREALSVIKATKDAYVRPTTEKWFCGKCLEEIEGNFEVCWSCGLAREDIEAAFPATADMVETLKWEQVNTEQLGRTTENPYESPQAMGTIPNKDVDLDPQTAAMESNFVWGLVFSTGSLFIPILPAMIAIAMFWLAFRKKRPLTTNSIIAFVAAIVVIVTSHLFWFSAVL